MSLLRGMSMKDMLRAAKAKKVDPPSSTSSSSLHQQLNHTNNETSNTPTENKLVDKSDSLATTTIHSSILNPVSQQLSESRYLERGFTPTQTSSQLPTYALNQYEISSKDLLSPPSAYLIPSFITVSESDELLSLIDSSPPLMWKQLKRRRLQMWGGIPSPTPVHTNGEKTSSFQPDPLPLWQQQIIDRICQTITIEAKSPQNGAKSSLSSSSCSPFFPPALRPNHVLLNEYGIGEGIFPHQDGPLYHSRVAILSLQSHTVMHFYKELKQSLPLYDFTDPNLIVSSHRPSLSIYLPPRSLFIFSDELYETYFHSIQELRSDVLDESVLNVPKDLIGTVQDRQKRISLTIRRVKD